MDIYYPFATDQDVPIALELYRGDHSVVDNRIIPHKHAYHELALICKGTCRHFMQGQEAVLIPGDLILISPHQSHAYQIMGRHECFNLQFYADRLGERWDELITDPALQPGEGAHAPDRLHAIRLTAEQAEATEQDVLHLEPAQAQHIEGLLGTMLREQEEGAPGYHYVLRAMLELVFVTIRRAQRRQDTALQENPSHHRELVAQAMGYMEAHLCEEIHFDALAEAAHLSAGHFRKVFKQVSGLTPVEYLNRLRIVKSLAYLQAEGLSVSEAAARVGVTDANYYTRLFKRVIGYSPRYFKRPPAAEMR